MKISKYIKFLKQINKFFLFIFEKMTSIPTLFLISLLVVVTFTQQLPSEEHLKNNQNASNDKTIQIINNNKTIPSPPSLQPSQSYVKNDFQYTENVDQFKSNKYSQRLELVVGCWLMSKQYLDQSKSEYLFFKNEKLKQLVTVKLVKQCMKRISRKDAVLKITELVGKNMEPAKKYENIINKRVIDEILIEVNKQNIAQNNQYQTNEEVIINKDSFPLQKTEETASSSSEDRAQQLKHQTFSNSLSEFDLFLTNLIKKYNVQFDTLKNSQDGIKGRVEEELKKREKYYFGFIPASSFTHAVFLVSISLSMVFCCTCFKYYRMRTKQKQQKKKMKEMESQEQCQAHSHAKKVKKMAKMSQMTMKLKNR